MATRGMIGYWNNETGEVKASYCHYDCYPSGVGRTLVTNYAIDDLAKAIATIGYATMIYETFAKTKTAAEFKDEETILYASVEEYIKHAYRHTGAEYLYLYDGVTWFVSSFYGDRRFEEVAFTLNNKKVA